MKILEFGAELVIDELASDEFLSECSCQQIHFVTTLLNLDITNLKEKLPKIYTSEILKTQLMVLYQSQGKSLDEADFHVLNSYEAKRIQVESGDVFEVLPCMPEDMSTSFMLAFRKIQNLKITHLYAGFTTDLSSILTNTKFAIWLNASGDSVDNLYAVKIPNDRCLDCEVEQAFENIQEELSNNKNIAKLLLRLPLFGCEAFIAQLASTYRGNVTINGLLHDLFAKGTKSNMQFFTEDTEEATIIISLKESLVLSDNPFPLSVNNLKISWLPLPDAFELSLLTRVVCSKSIHVINKDQFMESFTVNMTKYSLESGETVDTNIGASALSNSSTKSRPCHCSHAETPFKLPNDHFSMLDCMRSLAIAYTDHYRNDLPSLTIEEQLEKMFRSNTPTNTASTCGVVVESKEPQRNQNRMTCKNVRKTHQLTSSVEKPTTSQATKQTERTTMSKNTPSKVAITSGDGVQREELQQSKSSVENPKISQAKKQTERTTMSKNMPSKVANTSGGGVQREELQRSKSHKNTVNITKTKQQTSTNGKPTTSLARIGAEITAGSANIAKQTDKSNEIAKDPEAWRKCVVFGKRKTLQKFYDSASSSD